MHPDLDGLQVAYLDESGQIEYYLDLKTGEVVELRPGSSRAEIDSATVRYLRVPGRTADSETEDRWAFLATLEDPQAKRELSVAAGDASRFRALLAGDRMLERAWYSYKNDRATEAIDSWLRSNGLL